MLVDPLIKGLPPKLSHGHVARMDWVESSNPRNEAHKVSNSHYVQLHPIKADCVM